MKQMIVGVCGDSNCGKTALVRALTQSRIERHHDELGLEGSVDISYTTLRLPDGTVIDLMDMPGDEKYLKGMLAGAAGIDMGLLVISADEGVKPQTLIHLEILKLLGVNVGVIAITKCDLVDKQQMDRVEAEVRESLAGRDLEGLPCIRVSAKSGKGSEALKKYLMQAVSRTESRNADLPARLLIDGIQTNSESRIDVTGVLLAGTIRIGDLMHVMPQELSARVSILQVHHKKVKQAAAGTRVTVSLVCEGAEGIHFGRELAAPGASVGGKSFAGKLMLCSSSALQLKNHETILLYLGTAEIKGEITFLEEPLRQSKHISAYILVQSDELFSYSVGDRFIVRSSTTLKILGGGEVLEIDKDTLLRNDDEILTALCEREKGSPEQLVENLLRASPVGFHMKDIEAKSGLPSDIVKAALDLLTSQSKAVLMPSERVINPSALDTLIERVCYTLKIYHQKFPSRSGMPKSELQSALGDAPNPETLASMLASRTIQKQIILSGSNVGLADFKADLSLRQANLMQRVEEVYQFCGIFIPTLEAVCTEINAPRDAVLAILRVGVENNRFVRLSAEEYYQFETLGKIKEMICAFINDHGAITVSDFRDLTQSNRKFALQALEYLDKIGFTRREGDKRVLSENALNSKQD